MMIDIKQNPLDGNWDVIGPDHTDSFWTKENAIAFAKTFYNAKTVVPATTNAKCLDYQATAHNCLCPDYANRGGSYNGKCKHMIHMGAK